MNRSTSLLITGLLLLNHFMSPTAALAQHPPAKSIPSYAKWGRLAMLETQKKYPDAVIQDYLHVSRQIRSPHTAQETFKFWLVQGKKHFGVYVKILFDTTDEHVISIQFEESSN